MNIERFYPAINQQFKKLTNKPPHASVLKAMGQYYHSINAPSNIDTKFETIVGHDYSHVLAGTLATGTPYPSNWGSEIPVMVWDKVLMLNLLGIEDWNANAIQTFMCLGQIVCARANYTHGKNDYGKRGETIKWATHARKVTPSSNFGNMISFFDYHYQIIQYENKHLQLLAHENLSTFFNRDYWLTFINSLDDENLRAEMNRLGMEASFQEGNLQKFAKLRNLTMACSNLHLIDIDELIAERSPVERYEEWQRETNNWRITENSLSESGLITTVIQRIVKEQQAEPTRVKNAEAKWQISHAIQQEAEENGQILRK
jgi:hypothetical protein